jgi:hypothetical protein
MNDETESDKTVEKSNGTVKIIVFVIVVICIIIVLYYLYCYYSDDDEGFFGMKSDVSVGWNIEEMVEKIHNRQKANLSRLSTGTNYNI